MSANLVILSGCLTRDPEVKVVGSASTTVATSAIAVNSSFKKKDGSWHEEVSFVPIELWGQNAESFGMTCLKGDRVLVRGELKQERWETSEGQKRELIKVKVWEFGRLEKADKKNSQSKSEQQDESTNGESTNDVSDINSNNEIPF